MLIDCYPARMEISRDNTKCTLCAKNYSITKLSFQRKKEAGRKGKDGFKMSNRKIAKSESCSYFHL